MQKERFEKEREREKKGEGERRVKWSGSRVKCSKFDPIREKEKEEIDREMESRGGRGRDP